MAFNEGLSDPLQYGPAHHGALRARRRLWCCPLRNCGEIVLGGPRKQSWKRTGLRSFLIGRLCAGLVDWKPQGTATLYASMTGETLPRNIVGKQLGKLPKVRRIDEVVVY